MGDVDDDDVWVVVGCRCGGGVGGDGVGDGVGGGVADPF